jgi:hypothetical protein
VLAVLLGIAGCAGGAAAALAPQPAGQTPSPIARMVCQKKAAGEIAQTLGAEASVTVPTWTDHLYSCDYRYREGTMVLSVKELSSWDQTYAYFSELAGALHKKAPILGLGQGAFSVADGSVVVRKDWKVLLVNTAGLHGKVGVPPTSPGEIALVVAAVILGCWSGD